MSETATFEYLDLLCYAVGRVNEPQKVTEIRGLSEEIIANSSILQTHEAREFGAEELEHQETAITQSPYVQQDGDSDYVSDTKDEASSPPLEASPNSATDEQTEKDDDTSPAPGLLPPGVYICSVVWVQERFGMESGQAYFQFEFRHPETDTIVVLRRSLMPHVIVRLAALMDEFEIDTEGLEYAIDDAKVRSALLSRLLKGIRGRDVLLDLTIGEYLGRPRNEVACVMNPSPTQESNEDSPTKTKRPSRRQGSTSVRDDDLPF